MIAIYRNRILLLRIQTTSHLFNSLRSYSRCIRVTTDLLLDRDVYNDSLLISDRCLVYLLTPFFFFLWLTDFFPFCTLNKSVIAFIICFPKSNHNEIPRMSGSLVYYMNDSLSMLPRHCNNPMTYFDPRLFHSFH